MSAMKGLGLFIGIATVIAILMCFTVVGAILHEKYLGVVFILAFGIAVLVLISLIMSPKEKWKEIERAMTYHATFEIRKKKLNRLCRTLEKNYENIVFFIERGDPSAKQRKPKSKVTLKSFLEDILSTIGEYQRDVNEDFLNEQEVKAFFSLVAKVNACLNNQVRTDLPSRTLMSNWRQEVSELWQDVMKGLYISVSKLQATNFDEYSEADRVGALLQQFLRSDAFGPAYKAFTEKVRETSMTIEALNSIQSLR